METYQRIFKSEIINTTKLVELGIDMHSTMRRFFLLLFFDGLKIVTESL